MTNENNNNNNNITTGSEYLLFKTELFHPKVTWMCRMLAKHGIPHTIKHGMRGLSLFVMRGYLEYASTLIHQPLGPALKICDVSIEITVDDLPNSHPVFEYEWDISDLEFKELGDKIDAIENELEAVLSGPEPTKPEPEPEPEATLTNTVTEEEVSSDEWDFDINDDDDEEELKTDPDFDTTVPENPDTVAPAAFTGLEYISADEVLKVESVQYPAVSVPITMYDIDSSTISAMGVKILTNDPETATLYVRFKSGATVYRYNPVPRSEWNELLNLAVRKKNGIQEASVGSFFHYAIKVKADEGKLKCQRLNDVNQWVVVPTKAERTKAIKSRSN